MWWAGSERLTVYLGSQVAAVVPNKTVEHLPASWLQCESPETGFEQTLRTIGETARPSRKRLEVQLSGALARPFIFEAVDGLKSWVDANAVAATMAPEATGLAGPCSVWLDDWRPGKCCAAVAIDSVLRDRIEELAKLGRMNLLTLYPWWKTALDAATAQKEGPAQLLAAIDTDSLTVITNDRDRYTAMATYAPKPEHAQARAVLARAAMAMNLQVHDVVLVTLGRTSVNRADSKDTGIVASLAPVLERWT